MKKIMAKIAALILGAMIVAPVFAGMDTVVYTLPVIGAAASSTNSATYVVRGVVESVYVDFTAGCTGTVAITSDQATIFSKATITTDTAFYPRIDGQTTGGATRTWTVSTTGTNGPYTSTYTLAGYGEKIAVAGDVKVTVVGETATVTNNAVVTLIVNK